MFHPEGSKRREEGQAGSMTARKEGKNLRDREATFPRILLSKDGLWGEDSALKRVAGNN